MSADELRLERHGPELAVLTLNRPQRLNALTTATVRAFCTQLDVLAAEPGLRVLILTGAGRGFCAGWDLDSGMPAADGGTPQVADLIAGQELFSGMVRRLRALDKIVIAAVNGPAVGAGFALCLAADLRIAAPTASFHIGAVRIGLTAGECGISYHLPRLIGAARAFELMLTGRPVEAEEAGRIGLVSDLLATPEQLMPQALALARGVLAHSPYTTRQTKQLMWANLEAPSLDAAIELENRTQVLALLTEDFKEAREAFVAKRQARFSGR